MAVTIRPARPDDAPELREIEWAAGAQFRDIGMADIADAEPPAVDTLAAYAIARRSWVAVEDDDVPIGYVIVDLVDDNAHIEQISVMPAHQGAGVGRALIDRVREWATATNRPAITLTTFKDVPWNRPLYEHLGFVVITGDDIGPDLLQIRDHETDNGLDPETRVCMRLRLSDSAFWRT